MAKITDPDLLADEASFTGATEVFINPATKTIRLTVVGDLSNLGVQNENGVTLKCLYSFLKEEWKNDPNSKNLAAYPFPLTPITDESFEFGDGWDFYDDAARYLIRDAGWTVKNTSGNVTQKWAGVIGLGSIETNDQLYYQQSTGGAAVNVQLTGQINQAVQILRDDDGDGNYSENDDYDRRSYFALFAREYQQLYGKATLTDIGVTAMDSIAYRFPISTGTDLKITDSDGTVAASLPYTAIQIRYFDQAYSRDVDSGTNRLFGIVVDVGTHSGVDGSAPGGASVLTTAEGGMTVNAYAGGTLTIHEGTDEGVLFPIVSNTATTITVTGTIAAAANVSFTAQLASPVTASIAQIYTKVQYQLRQSGDIDATDQAVTGKTADALMRFVGNNLICGNPTPTNPNGGGSGVIIEGFAASDTNDIDFYDNSAATCAYPFVAALTLNFGDNLKNDADAKYWVWFTATHEATNTGFAITSASGQTATLTSTTTDLSQVLDNEEFLVSGFATPANNGMYRATANGAAGSVAVEKADTGDANFANESAGASVTLAFNPFGSASALLVDDNTGADMTGAVGGASSVQKSFNYDGNVQGGRPSAAAASITAVGIGLSTGQYVKATGTIAESVSNSLSLVAPYERNYANPA
jgi:hypothetical protein